MPRDQRLYMTFPNDIHRHPKILRLEPAVRWAFIEMNGEARIADNDGVFPAEDAEFEWGKETLDALVRSHPTRPLVVRRGDTYVIRDYAEHQETKASREDRIEKKREAGKKGAEARWGAGEPMADAMASAIESHGTRQADGWHAIAESESESESEPDTSKTSRDQSGSNRARELTDDQFTSETTAWMASQAGIDDPAKYAAIIQQKLGLTVAWDHMAAIVNFCVSRSKGTVRKGAGYAITVMNNDPEVVRQFIHESGFVKQAG